MKAVVLINMGSPNNENEMKYFLENMFMDKAILPYPYIIRKLLSRIISSARYKKSWSKYELIGGSPLITSMNAIKTAIETKTQNTNIHIAYSYSKPLISDVISQLIEEGNTEIQCISMYPHASFSTTGSIEKELQILRKRYPKCVISQIQTYYNNPLFIDFWEDLIRKHIEANSLTKPHIIFSAHAIPLYQVEQGDVYTKHIGESAKLIAQKVGCEYSVCYQSRIGRIPWTSPETTECIQLQIENGKQELIVVPISFITENLETLYDLDTCIIPEIRSKYTHVHISRIQIIEAHESIIKTFIRL